MREGGRKNNQGMTRTFHSPVLLFGLHNDKVPLVVDFFVQEIVVFLGKENTVRTLRPVTYATCSGQKALRRRGHAPGLATTRPSQQAFAQLCKLLIQGVAPNSQKTFLKNICISNLIRKKGIQCGEEHGNSALNNRASQIHKDKT